MENTMVPNEAIEAALRLVMKRQHELNVAIADERSLEDRFKASKNTREGCEHMLSTARDKLVREIKKALEKEPKK